MEREGGWKEGGRREEMRRGNGEDKGNRKEGDIANEKQGKGKGN